MLVKLMWKRLFQWINHNFLKANPDNSHVVFGDNEPRTINTQSESKIQILLHKHFLVSLLILN